jgi:hypothetical protein
VRRDLAPITTAKDIFKSIEIRIVRPRTALF